MTVIKKSTLTHVHPFLQEDAHPDALVNRDYHHVNIKYPQCSNRKDEIG